MWKKAEFVVLFQLLLIFSAPGLVCSKETSTCVNGKFKYKWAECTGQNKWIYVKGKKIPIQFDTEKSDKAAILALHALLPEVLGPNSDGKITLLGSYDTRQTPIDSGPYSGDPPGSFYHRFILSDWRLKTPFTRMVLMNGDNIPQEFRSVRRITLSANEFHDCEGFEPKRYSKPLTRITSKSQ